MRATGWVFLKVGGLMTFLMHASEHERLGQLAANSKMTPAKNDSLPSVSMPAVTDEVKEDLVILLDVIVNWLLQGFSCR